MNELTFLDLVVLKKIDPESSVERFGSIINTSFFETANLLGTIKIKGYVDIEASIGGMSKVMLTEAGKGILLMAEKKASEPIEPIDNALLHALAGGATTPEALQTALNVRSGDLTYHLNKLVAQGFIDFNVRSAKAAFTLTELGFNSTGGMRASAQVPQPAAADAMASSAPQANEEKKEHAPKEHRHAHDKSKGLLADLLGDSHAAPHPAHHQHEKKEHVPKPAAEKKPLTPEQERAEESRRRMLSKLEFYLSEYGLWIILILVVLGIFIGAVVLMLSKMAA